MTLQPASDKTLRFPLNRNSHIRERVYFRILQARSRAPADAPPNIFPLPYIRIQGLYALFGDRLYGTFYYESRFSTSPLSSYRLHVLEKPYES